jgi:uncharacterized glyoxalase superfamily protein PhnB
MSKPDIDHSTVNEFLDLLAKTGNTEAKLHLYRNNFGYKKILHHMQQNVINSIPNADLNAGSVMSTFLEAIAHSHFQIQQQTILMIEDILGTPKRGPGGCK